MGLFTDVLDLSDIAQFSFHIFLSLSPRRMGLVWFPYLGEGRKPHLLSGYCALGPGVLYCTFTKSPLRSFIVLVLQMITQSQRGSETYEASHKF